MSLFMGDQLFKIKAVTAIDLLHTPHRADDW